MACGCFENTILASNTKKKPLTFRNSRCFPRVLIKGYYLKPFFQKGSEHFHREIQNLCNQNKVQNV